MCIVMFQGKVHASDRFIVIKMGAYEAAYSRASMGAAGFFPEMLREMDDAGLRRWFADHPAWALYGPTDESLHQQFVLKLKHTCAMQLEIPIEYVWNGEPA